ncbi:dipeptidase [Roseivirga pacifica]|uniref:dipeptidase n=1 Tax=Roseivirga pacifica TaxID=1267423 RepID=UPI003BAB066E
MLNRKNFLKRAGLLSGAAITSPMWPLFTQQSTANTIIDLHAHPGLFFRKDTDMYPGDQALNQRLADIKNTGVKVVFMSLVADSPLLVRTPTGIEVKGSFAKGDGWAEFQKQLKFFNDLIITQGFSVINSNRAIDTNTTKILLTCEGGDFLDGDVNNIEKAYNSGLRSIQLVHYAQNNLGDLQTQSAVYNGLSDFGKSVTKRMNELGMVIDVAHASFKTVADVAEITTAPIILSHSILKAEADRPIAIRAITPDHAKLVAQTGGVIGAWPSGFSFSMEDFVDNTMRLIDLVGIEHVGLGTDMDANFKPVITSYSDIKTWAELLESKGLSKTEVNKILGGNAQRVLKQVLG